MGAYCVDIDNILRWLWDELIGKGIQVEDAGEVTPKGFDKQVQVFAVKWQV